MTTIMRVISDWSSACDNEWIYEWLPDVVGGGSNSSVFVFWSDDCGVNVLYGGCNNI